MRKKNDPIIVVSVKMPESQRKQLKAKARKHRCSLSALMRYSTERYTPKRGTKFPHRFV